MGWFSKPDYFFAPTTDTTITSRVGNSVWVKSLMINFAVRSCVPSETAANIPPEAYRISIGCCPLNNDLMLNQTPYDNVYKVYGGETDLNKLNAPRNMNHITNIVVWKDIHGVLGPVKTNTHEYFGPPSPIHNHRFYKTFPGKGLLVRFAGDQPEEAVSNLMWFMMTHSSNKNDPDSRPQFHVTWRIRYTDS